MHTRPQKASGPGGARGAEKSGGSRVLQLARRALSSLGGQRQESQGSKDTCPSGHALESYVTAGGHCRRCCALVPRGHGVWDCSQCKWWICGPCAGREDPSAAAEEPEAPQHFEPGQCPRGHELVPYATAGGYCANCKSGVHRGGLVMDCAACKWWICVPCSDEALARRGPRKTKTPTPSSDTVTWWRYRSPNDCPMGIRSEPIKDSSASTGALVRSGAIFSAVEELERDALKFLRLADGRGWVFARVGRVDLCVRLEELEFGNDEWWDSAVKDSEVSLPSEAAQDCLPGAAAETAVV